MSFPVRSVNVITVARVILEGTEVCDLVWTMCEFEFLRVSRAHSQCVFTRREMFQRR